MKPYPEDVDGLRVEHDGPVLALTLDRPDRRNAITDDMVMALIDAIDAAGSDVGVRAIRLAGAGDHFSSGFDLGFRGKESSEAVPRTGATQRRMRWHVNRLIPTLLETQTPVVAWARGWCVGLGLNLLLACDFAVVADDARLWAPFVESGFTPDSGGAWLLPRLAGIARAKDMLMLGRKVSGAEAADWGLVHSSVAGTDLDAATDALVGEVAAGATVAMGLAKLLINRSATVSIEAHLTDEALALELSSRSEDFKEASRARSEKRAPDFDGR